MMEDETVRDLMLDLAKKIGENFLNNKLYVLIPVFEKSNKDK